jgi:hypothetical protein
LHTGADQPEFSLDLNVGPLFSAEDTQHIPHGRAAKTLQEQAHDYLDDDGCVLEHRVIGRRRCMPETQISRFLPPAARTTWLHTSRIESPVSKEPDLPGPIFDLSRARGASLTTLLRTEALSNERTVAGTFIPCSKCTLRRAAVIVAFELPGDGASQGKPPDVLTIPAMRVLPKSISTT